MKATLKDGQTLLDLAIEHFGTWEAALAIALLSGCALTDDITDETPLIVPDTHYDIRRERYCQQYAVSPATAYDIEGATVQEEDTQRVFTVEFAPQFM